MIKKKICVATGTRAEYGLLSCLIKKIDKSEDFELQLIVTGAHLSPEFGLTYKEIEKDSYTNFEKIEMLLSSDTPVGISKSVGLCIISASEILERIKPDMIIILGDRYEMLAIATAALVANIPIAHINGGDITEGAIDDAIRHSITQMSILHFPSTEEYRQRILQMGRKADTVFNVGALGVENVRTVPLLTKHELAKSIDFSLDSPYALVTFHPVTTEGATSEKHMIELLTALNSFDSLNYIFTKANSDVDGRIINSMIDKFVSENPNKSVAFTSLGMQKYLTAVSYCNVVIGNSSSGILEVPSFKKPTVNIGDRQKGRLSAETVINCAPNHTAICESIKKALSPEFLSVCENAQNPYEKPNTSARIIEEIRNYFIKSLPN